jgi:acetoin utilization deacetylase AcuC-like enzyme
MHVWTAARHSFPLPEGHRFPLPKYALLRERVLADGLVTEAEVHEAEPISWADLAAVHDAGLLRRIRTGTLERREERGLGLPWSEALVARARRAVTATVGAAAHALRRGVAMHLGGGTHHAGRDFARGFCLFNDVAVATARLRSDGAARRVLVVDCDVHQGDGTAQILQPDPDAFTLSLHGARNYPFQRIPSDLDVDLPTGTGDEAYLAALDAALEEALARLRPDLAFYLAGADAWEGDRLGRLALTKTGLRLRDDLVLDRLGELDVPVTVVTAGGYPADVRDVVDINAATAAAVHARYRRPR